MCEQQLGQQSKTVRAQQATTPDRGVQLIWRKTNETMMKSDQERLLNLRRWPVFWNIEQLADRLGLSVDEVRVLIRSGRLPLAGNSEPGEKALFVAVKVEKMLEDHPDWPDKARRALISYHRRRNYLRRNVLRNGNAATHESSEDGKASNGLNHAKDKNNR